ncbi:MAG: hypothetical protein IJY47_06290 [Clostridia bacterium]|nr:hypothetical protein [Clostridia bacterium]
MMSIAEKKNKTLLRRRKQAIVLSAILVVVLAIALVFVMDYVQTITCADADGTEYYIRKKNGVYALYDKDRQILATDSEYGYYITALGTLIEVDAETGEYEIIAVVDTEGNEVVGINSRILLFPHIEKKNILSIEVHNQEGSFTFCRYNPETDQIDKSGDFIIKGSALTTYDQELFAKMYVSAGYTLSLMKLENPIKDENGEFTEYGLAPEMRVDEEGNEYLYEPAYYILTDVNGNRYKVLIGDQLVTEGGYYTQYVDLSTGNEVKRDAVYVADTTTGTTLLAPIEDYVTPLLSYPMEMNNFFDVENFTISKRKDGATPTDLSSYEKIVAFSYVDLSLRENTISEKFPYILLTEQLDGYMPSDASIDVALQNLYSPSYADSGVCLFAPTEKDLAEYGLYRAAVNDKGETEYYPFSEYTVGFEYDLTDADGNYVETIHQTILISEPNERGNRYVYTIVSSVEEKNGEKKYEFLYTFNSVVEVEGHVLEFVTWDKDQWISTSYIQGDIAFIEQVTLTAPGYEASFKLDNSKSDQSDGTNSSDLTVHATDSKGRDISTFGSLTVEDVNGYTWVVTARHIQVYTSSGEERNMADGIGYYDYNLLGTQVLCRNGYIDGKEFDVEVSANAIRLSYPDGTTETITRHSTSLFRSYYQTLLYATIVNSYPLTEEEEQALVNDESKWLLTLTVTTRDTDGTLETKECKFYQVASRKAYLTINGNGGFYVNKNRVDKFLTDAERFFNMELITPTDKR